MDKIKTQDVWVRLGSKTTKLDKPVLWIDGEAIEKHSNMVVLTKEQAIKMVEDAMEEQRINLSKDSWKEMREDRQFYLTQLFGEGETGQK
jgi:hypothetical protein